MLVLRALKQRTSVRWAILVALAASLAAASAHAQSRNAPKPKELKLTTRDGVRLVGTYYPSKLGREAVPVVMLHDFKETRAVFASLARYLQDPPNPEAPSHAVITIDLRGHGDSTKAIAQAGGEVEFTTAQLRLSDYADMVDQDLEAVRRELVELNDAGELNLNRLTLVGAGMGANVAVTWAAKDWDTPQLPARKQGQDVKALVLLSPQWRFRGLPLLRPLQQPGLQRDVSYYIAYGGEDRKQEKDAELINRNLERFHPEPPRDQVWEKQSLFLVPIPAKLSGSDLLNRRQFAMPPLIAEFIQRRVVEQDFPWVSRSLSR